MMLRHEMCMASEIVSCWAHAAGHTARAQAMGVDGAQWRQQAQSGAHGKLL